MVRSCQVGWRGLVGSGLYLLIGVDSVAVVGARWFWLAAAELEAGGKGGQDRDGEDDQGEADGSASSRCWGRQVGGVRCGHGVHTSCTGSAAGAGGRRTR